MDDSKKKIIIRYHLAFCQGALCYLLFIPLTLLAEKTFAGAPNVPSLVFALTFLIVGKFLLLYGVLRNFTSPRLYGMDDVEAAKGDFPTFLRHILRRRTFQVELLPLLLLSVLIPPRVCFKIVVLLFPYLGIPFTAPARWGCSLVIGAVSLFLAVLAKRTSLRLSPAANGGKAKERRISQILFVLGGGLLIWPALLFLLTDLVALIADMGVWALLIPPTLLLILGLLYLVRYLRAVRIRRRFYRKLARVCRETGAETTGFYRPYRSVFSLGHRHTFTLWHKGKRYDCQMLASLRRNNPLYFTETGEMLTRHVYGLPRLRVHLFTGDRPVLFECTTKQ